LVTYVIDANHTVWQARLDFTLSGARDMKVRLLFASCVSVGLLVGCDGSAMIQPKTETPPAVAPSSPVAGSGGEAATVAAETSGSEAGIAQKAGVGVGIRGDSLRSEEGVGKIIASPAVTYFNVREKAVFEIQIPHALNLYKALEGKLPKSHEEFMDKIVKANAIQLPELKPGMKYRYRPDQGELGELWVEPIEGQP